MRPQSSMGFGENIYKLKKRPVNFVLRSPWSAREFPPQALGYPVNPGNVDEGQGCQTSTRKLVRTVTPRTEFQNMKYTNHQYMTKVFRFMQKKLGITAGYSTFALEALKTSVLIWGMFMSSSMKAASHLGPIFFGESGKSTRTRTSWKFRVYSTSHRNLYWSILKRF